MENPSDQEDRDSLVKQLLNGRASKKKIERRIKDYLDAHPKAAAEEDDDGDLPLHYAAAVTCNPKVVKLILDAHPQAAAKKDNRGRFPLHIAASNDNPEVVKIILDAHPQAAAEKNKYGCTPLHYAVDMGSVGLIIPLRKEKTEVVKILLGANPKAAKVPDENGRLPLHIAVQYTPSPDVLRMLLYAHPEAAAETDNDGNRPLHIYEVWSGENPHSEVKQLLLRATVRVIRWPLSAKVIQRAWRECRDNPAYKMSERVFEKNIEDTVRNYLPSNNYNF